VAKSDMPLLVYTVPYAASHTLPTMW